MKVREIAETIGYRFVTYDTVNIFNIIIKYDRPLSCDSYRYSGLRLKELHFK